jgi:hypothetical protein
VDAGPTRIRRIETDKTILPHLPVSTEERAGNLIEACVAQMMPATRLARTRALRITKLQDGGRIMATRAPPVTH